jgi:FPC/CPF motif-containing protein YcgG
MINYLKGGFFMKENESSINYKIEKINPFSEYFSGYGHLENGTFLSHYPVGSPMQEFHINAHDYFKSSVGGENFACVAGRTVARTNRYAFCAYQNMTSVDVAEGLCYDLQKFKQEFDFNNIPNAKGIPFMSFVAAFKEPEITSQLQGVESLYTLLKNIHYQDKRKNVSWNQKVSSDIHSEEFSFSAGGDSFFVPMLYKYSASPARRTDITMLVFNAHDIFEKLRQQGGFEKLKTIIRSRQEWIHPYLGDYGEVNEFRQYGLVDLDEESLKEEQNIRNRVLGECPFKSE